MNLLQRLRAAFRVDVGYVNQMVNAQTVNIAAPPPVDRLPLLRRLGQLDRSRESETLRERVRVSRVETRQRPLIASLRGVSDDSMARFMRRFGDQDLGKCVPDAWDHLGLIPWPEEYFRSIIGELTSKISARRPGSHVGRVDELDALAEMIRTYGKTLCFGHVLTPDRCLRRPDILEDWARFFGQTCVNPSGGHLLICMLFIEVQDPESAACRALLAEIERLGAAYDFQPVVSFTLVEPHHLKQWIEGYNDAPEPGQMLQISPGLIGRVFGENKALRFEAVHGAVSAALGIETPDSPASGQPG